MDIFFARDACVTLCRRLLAVVLLVAMTTGGGLAQEGGPVPEAAGGSVGPSKGADGDSSRATNAAPAVNADKAAIASPGPLPQNGSNAAASKNVHGGSGVTAREHDQVTGLKSGHGDKSGGGIVNPIDTRITVQAGHASKAIARDRLFKKIDAVRPPHHDREPPHLSGATAMGGPARNAVGIVDTSSVTQRAVAPARVFRQAPSAGIAVNAIGGAARNSASIPAPGTGHLGPGLSAAVVTAPANASINGTTMVRAGSGPAVVGGPSRIVTGINGTTLRPKH
jgi:hypothetical protein